MTRYFEVKVTGCTWCIHAVNEECWGATIGTEKLVYQQNKDQLTDSCPMAAQHKESETKCTPVKHS